MYLMKDSLAAWNSEDFASTVKNEVANLPSGILPLQQATIRGGMIDDSELTVMLLNRAETSAGLEVRLGIFFNEIVGGWSCHDDPVVENCYAEVLLCINPQTGEATFAIGAD